MNRLDYPALYRVAGDASQDGQRSYKRIVTVDLSLIVVASALGVIGLFVPAFYSSAFAAILAVVLLVAIVAKFLGRMRRDDKDWFDGRAVAESVKTLTWRYMMRYEPFEDDTTCDMEFRRELDAIRDARSDLQLKAEALSVGADQITSRMREIRQLPVMERRGFYVTKRLEDQVEWYRSKSRTNRILASRLFWASIVAQLIVLIVAIVQAVFPSGGLGFVGPFLALAAAFTAWSQLGRHDELSKSYAFACQELSTIKSLADMVSTEEELSDIVRDGEGAISREHTMWIAKRGEPLPPRTA